jgi:predicted nucleotidyltransferase
MSTTKINNMLFGKTRTAILSLLLSQPERSYYLRQIARLSEAGLGAVQRELGQLCEADIITRLEKGRNVYYKANSDSPFCENLRGIFAAPGRMTGSPVPIPSALSSFCRKNKIKKLSLFGSILRADFRPDSDVDILVEFVLGEKPGFLGLQKMENELSGLFGGRRIDLHTAEDLSRYFRERVVQEAELQYASD